ncbi:Ku protein [Alicyclobacillus fastidiosus]|uniref:Non-homologous end joining protein Ku n=1 Tax=Alicyclobacillus fastidiosus TaxID=392011 RepID=A0ABY6ZBQ5_9BACL|nr:Ku protein [Alicyclobacillus fastidiosus]WAH39681.1 Ku protein [Alicyclobacillus fastidiosus]GMA60894.1 non-homologous end joining protein Ku [Alicyclobacillus fastidiosus]
MHSMWKGSISFGLINVPVRMFKATESQGVRFRQLHKACKTPIQYHKTCPTCQVELKSEDIVRGFEYAKGQFVVIDDEELEALTKTRSQTLDIVHFAQAEEVDPVYYDNTYYLAPEANGRKAYALLADALGNTGRIAVATSVLRQNESMACIRMKDGVLILQTLFWPDEVRQTGELPFVHQPPAVAPEELEMAEKLIEQLSKPFDPAAFHDERREQVQKLVEQKLADADPEELAPAATAPAADVISLMDALQKSLKMAEPAVKRKRTTRKKTS